MEFQSPAPLPPQRSHIGVAIEAKLSALQRELGSRVPVTLARERRRPVGAAGDVSYVVRRGAIGLKLDSDRLLVSVPVDVDVEICKPLGPFCPTYGRCQPRLSAVASVPALLDERYAVGKSRVAISVVSPCTIAGIDATPEIRQQARQQVGNVQARIDASMPELRSSVASMWELLHHPVALGKTTCLRITPDRISQARPVASKDTLRARISAEGELGIEDPCEAPEAPVRPAPLPRLATLEEVPDDVVLRVPIRTSWVDISAAFTRSLAAKPEHGLGIVKVEARAAEIGARAHVALQATVRGRVCGDAWFVGVPRFDASTSRVRLGEVRQAPGEVRQPELEALARRIEAEASAALPVDVASGPAALEQLVVSLSRGLPPQVTAEHETARAEVSGLFPESQGLVALAVFSGRTRLGFE